MPVDSDISYLREPNYYVELLDLNATVKMVDDVGRELREYNETIVRCILLLREQRNELAYIIERQYQEREKLETEMERLTYKLCLINRSLTQRIHAKDNYDRTITEIEGKYEELVKTTGCLAVGVQKDCEQLDSTINKTTSTDDAEGPEKTPSPSHLMPLIEEIPCGRTEKNCQCSPASPPLLNPPQIVPFNLEFPTKLEKTNDEAVRDSIISDMSAYGGSVDPNSEHLLEVKVTGKEEDSDEGHNYALNYRQYS